MAESLELRIEECHDCPRFRTREVRHWLLGNGVAYEYSCSKAGRVITPDDGVRPPPKWCPLRASGKQS
jgi:hypothetical protein